MHQSDVSRLERGKVARPRRDRLARIAQALGLPLGELLARSDWAGAEAEFGPVGATPKRVPRPPMPSTAVGRPVVRDPWLRELIAQARKTRAQAEAVLRRCEEVWGLANRPAGGAAGATPPATGSSLGGEHEHDGW